MRLLRLDERGDISLIEADGRPDYAILSHTWGRKSEEVTYGDLMNGVGKHKLGYNKIRFCVEQAARDGLQYSWVDTCCIDQSSSAEVSTAVNSMFRWYRNAAKCYVYLSDVPNAEHSQESFFSCSRWFTRGWTLQELLAPASVEFFSRDGIWLGDKESLELQIQQITGISINVLRGDPLSEISVKERMSWTRNRETTVDEDIVYSLLGIFDVHMPLIYGEGVMNGLRRLGEEIEKSSSVYQKKFTRRDYKCLQALRIMSLSYAATNGYNSVVRQLLELDEINVDFKDKYGETPLLSAAKNGHEAVVKLLLATQAKVDWEDTFGQTPLIWAASNGHDAIVRLLLATGEADVEIKDNHKRYGRTPLLWAAAKGHGAVVQLLLAAQAEVDPEDNMGQTPLSWAARNGHEAVVKLLLATQAEVDSEDNLGQTPLMWAASHGNEAVVKLLLATGKADIEIKDNHKDGGRTPLLWAAAKGHDAVAKLLLATDKINVDTKDDRGRTALFWAASNGHEAVVKVLLSMRKISVDSKDDQGQTPLLRAAENGYEAVVTLLLSTGKINVESKDNKGRTPLSRATEKGHKAVVRLLRPHITVALHQKHHSSRR